MRVVFVGVHNKSGFSPLDGKSVSGKRIDAVIEAAGVTDYLKTNLYDVNVIPNEKEVRVLLEKDWLRRVDPKETDIIVTLGYIVNNCLPPVDCKRIRAAHPSLQYSKTKPEKYIQTLADQIKKYLNSKQ